MVIKSEITIIFPVYGNHEIFISILDVLFISGFKGCIIIINDKPDDESAGKDILKFIERRSNCSYIANKFNEGYTKSVNKALAKVKTEFVMICNSDAFITQCALEIMLKDLNVFVVSHLSMWIILIVLAYFSYIRNWNLIPLLGISTCLYLLTGMTQDNWIWFGWWFLIGLIIYFVYGRKNSKLNEKEG